MGIRVLVADDSGVMRTIIANMLRDFGVKEIVEAADGSEAVKAFEPDRFDLVLLDWQMPGMCGLEVIEAIRATGSEVPIIMVTATGTQNEHVVDAIETGASDYLLKPFAPAVLREKLAKYCSEIISNDRTLESDSTITEGDPAAFGESGS